MSGLSDLWGEATGDVATPEMSASEQEVLDQIYGLIQQQEAGWEVAYEEYMGTLGDFGQKKVVTEGEWHEATNKPEYNADEQELVDLYSNLSEYVSENFPNTRPENFHYAIESDAYKGYLNNFLQKRGLPTTSENRALMLQHAQTLALREPSTEGYTDPETITWEARTEEEWREQASEEEILDYENRLAIKQRQQKALAGELPLTEAGQQRKEKERDLTKEALKRKGVSEDSTAWIQTMSQFDERWGIMEEAERFGQITQGSQDTLAMAQLAASQIGSIGATYTGMQGGQQGLMQSYAGYMQPFTSYNMASYQAQAAQQAQASGLLSSLFGIGGTTAGAGGSALSSYWGN